MKLKQCIYLKIKILAVSCLIWSFYNQIICQNMKLFLLQVIFSFLIKKAIGKLFKNYFSLLPALLRMISCEVTVTSKKREWIWSKEAMSPPLLKIKSCNYSSRIVTTSCVSAPRSIVLIHASLLCDPQCNKVLLIH